jgi:hypothetical protein
MAFEMAEFYKVFDADGPDPEMKYTLPLIADVITR